MTSKVDYAVLSAYIYNDQRGGGADDGLNQLKLPSEWRDLADLGFTTGTDLVENNIFSFTAGAYVNDAGEIVIAYKGTDFLLELAGRAWNTAGDIVADVGLAFGAPFGLPQLLAATSYYAEVVQWASENGYDANKISFTGHSLGGGLASAMAVWFDRSATTFAEAPFELSAINANFLLAAKKLLQVQAAVSESPVILQLITRLEGLAIPFEYQERQAAVSNYYVDGEFLGYGRIVLPTVLGTDHPIDIGDQPIGMASDLHSMNLHLALLADDRLRQACIDIPELVPALLDPKLYFYDPNSAKKDFVTALVADQLTGDLSRQDGLLGKFTSEILKLDVEGGIAAQPKVRTALIAVAMEYCYFNDASSASTLFTVSDGGIHFKYSDIDADVYKSLNRLSDAVTATLNPQERMLSQSARIANAWHIQSGDAALNWTASASDPQNDAAIGGANADSIDAGAGNDVIIGGAGSDSLTGGKGRDTLLGGTGNDKYYFSGGDGTDIILDSDGQGEVFFDGVKVQVGDRLSPHVWRSVHGLLEIYKIPSAINDGEFNLRIRNGTRNSILIQNWHPGDLGLQLTDGPILGATVTIEGGSDPDALEGTASNETIIGYGSGDILSGGDGNDHLYAEDVVDVETAIILWADGFETLGYLALSGDSGDEVLLGGAGNDTLIGSGRGDVLSGGSGEDLLIGGRGDDFLVGDTDYSIPASDDNETEGFDWIFTQVANEAGGYDFGFDVGSYSLSPIDSSADIIYAGGGDDVVFSNAGNDSIFGDDGDDLVLGGAGEDTILGGAGSDVLQGDSDWKTVFDPNNGGDDFIDGGRDDDFIYGEGGNDFLMGGDGDDLIRGDHEETLSQYCGYDFIDGGSGDDILSGGGLGDILVGGIGNDVLRGDSGLANSVSPLFHGNDYLDGGDDDDEIVGDGGNDTLIGGSGHDYLYGDSPSDTLGVPDDLTQGIDYLDGGAGNDKLVGGALGDTLLGGKGNDTLRGDGGATEASDNDDHSFDGNDYLDGGDDSDVIYGVGGSDTLIGGAGDDHLYGDALEVESVYQAGDYLSGGEGNDVLVGGGGNDSLNGGADNDQLFGDSGTDDSITGDDYLSGGAGNDVLSGEGGADVLVGGDGDDTLAGEATYTPSELHGNDYLDGGAGNDILLGEGGSDRLFGGDDHDRLYGESSTTPVGLAGEDYLDGGAGNDMLFGEGGADTLLGGDGSDLLYGESGSTLLSISGDDVLDGGRGRDQLFGGGGDDVLKGGDDDDVLYAQQGDDCLEGGAGNDVLEGGVGNDLLLGGTEDDHLVGGDGADILDGGSGSNDLSGGHGDDVFRFNRSTSYSDIYDSQGFDRIELGVGVSEGDVTLIRTSTRSRTGYSIADGLALVLDGSRSQLLINSFFSEDGNRAIEEIRFANGVIWNSTEIAVRTINQGGTVDSTSGTSDADVFFVDHSGDVIVDAGDGIDSVTASTSFALTNDIENLTLTGVLSIDATGNDLSNTLIGNAASNRLHGSSYSSSFDSDTLIGGGGDDFYYVDGAEYAETDDVVIENPDEGYDTIISNGAWQVTLPGNVEALVARGAPYSYAQFIGNSLDNVIDTSQVQAGPGTTFRLDGDTGADILIGGYGIHTYVVDNSLDKVINQDGIGADDTVEASISYALGLDVSNLTLTGVMETIGTGNAFNNRLDGSQNTTSNTLLGGLGDDTYVINEGDVIIESESEGNDTVEVGFSYVLQNHLENLVLTGDQVTIGTGNALSNRLDASFNSRGNMLLGGLGDDTYVLDNDNPIASEIDDAIEYAGEGIDTIVAAGNYGIYILGANIENGVASYFDNVIVGNELDNVLTADIQAYASTLIGGDGADTLIANASDGRVKLSGGRGADTYHVLGSSANAAHIQDTDAGESQDGAVDTIEFASGVTNSNVTFSRAENHYDLVVSDVSGRSFTVGGFFAYGAARDRIERFRFSDGTVLTAEQVAVALVIAGTSNADSLTASASGSDLKGFGGSDILNGGVGNDFLDGGSGVDILIGGGGHDLYRVDDIGDVVVEGVNQGADTVESNIDYALAENLENLILLGSDDLTGSGNDGSNKLVGNSGADTLIGGLGDDTYVIDSLGDVVVEAVGEGYDIVNSSASYTLSSNVEALRLLDGAAISATGNALDNYISGNSLANVIDGGAGNDVLEGGAGDDIYIVDDATDFDSGDYYGDIVNENADSGNDIVLATVSWTLGENIEGLTLVGSGNLSGTGNNLENILIGSAGINALMGREGDDFLDGGLGNDILRGGEGDDSYVVDSTLDSAIESVNQGIDTVRSSVNWTLASNIEKLVLTGIVSINGTGNTLANVLTGNSGNNILNGGTGADSLIGAAGNDTYVIDNVGDSVLENLNEGIDLVQASVTYTLGADLENLTLTGSSAVNGTGNVLDNVLTGNSANNTLTGGSGNDTLDGGAGSDMMVGGQGDDSYTVNAAGDVVIENASEGMDVVKSLVTYTIGNNIENLTLIGTSAINGTGNALNNVLIGNSANNRITAGAGDDTLDGGSGNDTMIGGQGNDNYVVAQASDIVTEALNEGIDLVRSSISLTLGNNVENLLLTGTSAISGTGNALDNFLTGNSVNNTLTGGTGNDTLDGGAGTDTMRGGLGDDTYIIDVSTDVTAENANEGVDLVYSSVTRTLAANIELLFLAGTAANNGTGNTLSNLLRGNTGNNTLAGGGGVDILEGGGGNDILSNSSGKVLLNGGAGTDTLTGSSSNDLVIGGTGNDALTTGSGADIIAFNKGDGLDTVAVSATKDNTLSIGGGAQYADLLFQKSGNDLILKVGASDQITFVSYYASTSNRSVSKLQVVLEGSGDYNAGASNAMYNKKIETFNFDGLVSAFDAARAANPSLTTWALSGNLAAQYLSGSDTAAMGGDLAYRYGRFGNLSDLSFTPAAGILGASTFGTSAQTLQAGGSLQDATQRLS